LTKQDEILGTAYEELCCINPRCTYIWG